MTDLYLWPGSRSHGMSRPENPILHSGFKRFAFLAAFLFFIGMGAKAQTVVVPAGNPAGTGNFLPISPWYYYMATDVIYLSSEIGTTGTIQSIGFYLNSRNAVLRDVPFSIKMRMTSATTLPTSARNYSTFSSSATTVWSGVITEDMLQANNWVNITLTTPFNYTGTNLEVFTNAAVATGDQESSTSRQFRWSTVTGSSRAITWQRDDAATLNNTYATNVTAIPNTRFIFGTCGTPTGVNITSILPTGATASWTAPSPAPSNGYQYELRTSGAGGSGAGGLVQSGTTAAGVTTKTFAGLSSATTYKLYLKSDCGATSGLWTSGTSFTTTCVAITALPHSESFDAAAMPTCWTRTAVTGGLWTPAPDNDASDTPHSGANFLSLPWIDGTAQNSFVFSPQYNLSSLGGAQARVSLWIYRNDLSVALDAVSIGINTSATATGAVTLLTIPSLYTSAPAVAAEGWYNYTVNIPTTYNAAPFYMIIRGTEGGGGTAYSLSVDDYRVELAPPTITGFSPTAVCSNNLANTNVTITGTNLSTTTSLTLNGQVTPFSVINATTLEVHLQSTSTAGQFAITGANGTASSAGSLSIVNNPVVDPIAGGNVSLCETQTVQLSDPTPGGIWSSSNNAIAQVDSDGLVTAVSKGLASITYTVTDLGCSTAVSTNITVNEPVEASIPGAQTVVTGNNAVYSVTATGDVTGYQWQVSTDEGDTFEDLAETVPYSGTNSNTLTITATPDTLDGYYYRVIVFGTAPCADYESVPAILHVGNTGIGTQPSNVSLCSNGNGTAVFTVVATGEAETYSWRENQGGGFGVITDGTFGGITYQGSQTAQLTVSGLGLSQTGRSYLVVITGPANTATSNVATVTINEAVSVNSNPQTGSTCYSGGSTVFTVGATGNVASYQWQYSADGSNFANVSNNTPVGASYTDATTASLTVTTTNTISPSGTYYYRALVNGASPCATAISGNAQLQIFMPSVTSQPVASSVLAGQSTSFSVASSDGSATYQWQYATAAGGTFAPVANGTPAGMSYTGATSSTLNVSTTGIAAAGSAFYYRAVVTSNSCSINSSAAQLTVTNYCVPSTTNVNTYFTAFSTSGGVTNINNPASGFSTGGYGNFSNLSASQTQGLSVNFTSTITGTGNGVGGAIWVDWNHNGTFETTELAASTPTQVTVFAGSFAVPSTALPGPTRMRVMVDFNTVPPTNPCAGPAGRREVEDYTFTVIQAPPCSGTPLAGAVSANPSTFCNSGSAVLSLNGYSNGITGISIQWYNTATGLIPSATGSTYTTPTLTSSASYFARVTCAGSGLFADSASFTVTISNPAVLTTTPATRCGTGTLNLSATATAGDSLNWFSSANGGSLLASGATFTTPSLSNTTTYYVAAAAPSTALPAMTYCAASSSGTTYYISGFSTSGGSVNISNTGTLQSPNGYGDYTAMAVRQTPGGTVNFTATWPSSTYGLSVFVDWNNDGDFDDSNEKVYATTTYVTSPRSSSFTVPTGLALGNRRMRVRADFLEEVPAACGSTTSSEIEDYTLTIAPCESARTAVLATVNTAPELTLSSSSATICSGNATGTVTIASLSSNYDSYVWSPSNGVSGTAQSGFTFNPTTTTTYTLTASQTGGSLCQNTATFVVTVNPTPTTPLITPASATVCAGVITPLTIGMSSTGLATAIFGNGNSSPADTAYPNPLSAYYGGAKHQMLVSASELSGQGLVAGSSISSVSFDLSAINVAGLCTNFTIRMGATSNTALTGFVSGTTAVYGPATFTPSVTGIVTFNLSTPYVWNGTSNLIVETIHNAGNDGNGSGTRTRTTTTATNTVYYGAKDNVTGGNAGLDAAAPYSVSGASNARPNMRFGFAVPLVPTWAPTTGLFTDATATTPYTGGAAVTVYAKPSTTTSYIATVTNSSNCPAASLPAVITVNQFYDFYVDNDADNYGTGTAISLCATSATTAPVGYAAVAGDCNDAASAVNPGASEVPFNGIDDNCNGTIDEGSQIYSQVLASQCGTTLASISSLIGAVSYPVPVDGYRFEVTNTATNVVQVIDRNVPNFALTMLATYDYAATYSIRVQLRRNGLWLNYYGPACLVSSPAILDQGGAAAVNPSQCGIVLPSLSTLIATTSLANVTGYRFRVTNLTDSGDFAQQVIERPLHWFALTMLTRYNYGTEYQVEVSVKTNGEWSGYGSPCNVSSPAVPTLTNCGATIAANTTTVSTQSLNRAQAYRFEITNLSTFEQIVVDRSTNYFKFQNVPNYVPGGLYGVRIAVQTSGYWSPFGEACAITAPGAARSAVKGEDAQPTVDFRAVVYPNPYTESFALDMDTSSEEKVQVKVYDMVGKLLEDREFAIDMIETQQFGERYPSGVYNIVVTQAGFVKTLRVIKR